MLLKKPADMGLAGGLGPLHGINAGQIDGRIVALHEGQHQFEEGHGQQQATEGAPEADPQQEGGALREVQQVEGGVEEFIGRAHEEEHGPGGVVHLQYPVGVCGLAFVAHTAL